MDLQFANVDSLETSFITEDSSFEVQECSDLNDLFGDGFGLLGNPTTTPGDDTRLGIVITPTASNGALNEEYGLGPIMTRIVDGDPDLWPAKVLNIPGEPEINQMYSPCVLGIGIGSRPQTMRDLTHIPGFEDPAKGIRAHRGVDIFITTNTPLYACFPGIITYYPDPLGNSKKYAAITIVSDLKFADGETATIKVVYGHVRKFAQGIPSQGEVVINSSDPNNPVLVGYSGGAKGDIGSGPSTGQHLHWELHENGKPQGSHRVYRGKIKDPTTGAFAGEDPPPFQVVSEEEDTNTYGSYKVATPKPEEQVTRIDDSTTEPVTNASEPAPPQPSALVSEGPTEEI
ncbi:MAG: M23 family metallopeptidase [Schleiferiaceae bacterium]